MSLKTRWAGTYPVQAIFYVTCIKSYIPVKVDLSGADDNLQHFSYLQDQGQKKIGWVNASTYIEEFHFLPSKRNNGSKKYCYFSFSDIF